MLRRVWVGLIALTLVAAACTGANRTALAQAARRVNAILASGS